MNREELIDQIKRKKSFLCIGLDPDLSKIPTHLLNEEEAFDRQRARLGIMASSIQHYFKCKHTTSILIYSITIEIQNFLITKY